MWDIVEFFLSNSFLIIEFLFQVRARVGHCRPARRHLLLAAGRVPIYQLLIMNPPDGTFCWLQSFVGHYSLPSWMRQSDAKGDRAGAPRAKKRNTELLISLCRRAGLAPRDGAPQAVNSVSSHLQL